MDMGFLKDIFIAWMTVFSVTLFIISLISFISTNVSLTGTALYLVLLIRSK